MMRIVMRGALVALLTVTGLGACGDSTKERLAAIKIGGSCTLDSDCEHKLVCIFAHCHEQCRADSDCNDPPTQRCIAGRDGVNVCQLEDDASCAKEGDCEPAQVCAADGECHDPCNEQGDCVGDEQLCTPSGECASSDPNRDELGPDGNLVRKVSGGTGGASGSGGSSNGGAGQPPDSGAGGAASGGAPETGGTASGGAPETGGTASGGATPDAGPDGGRSNDAVETGDDDTRDNNTYDKAFVVDGTHPASIYLPAGDVDWLKIQAPAGDGAFVLEIEVPHQSGARSFLDVLDGVNRLDIVPTPVRTGGSGVGKVYLTVGGGTVTYLQLRPDGANTGDHRIDVRVSFEPEDDAHEPNDTQEAAASIEPNTDVRAQCMRKYVTAADQTLDDWYKIGLKAGPATFIWKTQLASTSMKFRIGGPGLSERDITYTGGYSGPVTLMLPQDGDYYVLATFFTSGVARAWATLSPPAYMTDQYVFQVQQP